jgi:hypothetical protein
MPQVRFVVSDINEKEFLDDNIYDILEPTLNLEIDGRDVFKAVGLDGVKRVVVMGFLELSLRLTRRMISDLATNATDEYKYWFLGTGYGLRVKRSNDVLQFKIDTNPKMGPLANGNAFDNTQLLGKVSVRDWVRGLTTLSRELNDRISAANPNFRPSIFAQEKQRKVLEDWLATAGSGSS